MPNKTLHWTAIPLRSIAAGEMAYLRRCFMTDTVFAKDVTLYDLEKKFDLRLNADTVLSGMAGRFAGDKSGGQKTS